MFMLMRNPEPELELKWNGSMKGIFICALRGVPVFHAHEAEAEPEPEPPLPTIGRVIACLRHAGPQTVSSLATQLHDAGGDVADALRELEAGGIVRRCQPGLFALDPQRGERFALVGE